MPVVVVESPAKAKTINKYLGSDYTVLASYGHVRDLPPKDGSVDTDSNFEINGKSRMTAKSTLRRLLTRSRTMTFLSSQPTLIAKAKQSAGTCKRP